jgi:GxxExxY protein
MKPQMNTDTHRLNEITERIIGCAFIVINTLGCGFLEKVYENALVHELRKTGFRVKQQESIEVYYDNVMVGEYTADILVEGCVLIELKAVNSLNEIHIAQCLNYLKATDLKLCLLLNFGNPKLEIKRIAL